MPWQWVDGTFKHVKRSLRGPSRKWVTVEVSMENYGKEGGDSVKIENEDGEKELVPWEEL